MPNLRNLEIMFFTKRFLFSKNFYLRLISLLIVSFSLLSCGIDNSKKDFIISSGDKKGSYFAVATSICDVFNKYHSKQKLTCIAKESKGSDYNLRILARREADLAMIKTVEFNKNFIADAEELNKKTITVAQIHDEDLTFLVSKTSTIRSLSDLNNKIVNIGSIGSSSALIASKYLSDFKIKPKEILHLGATKSFAKICDKKIDAWLYFIGHPNYGFNEILQKCDVRLISLSQKEVHNFTNQFPFLRQSLIDQRHYIKSKEKILTVSSQTILAARDNIDPLIIDLIKNVVINHKDELIRSNPIFKNF